MKRRIILAPLLFSLFFALTGCKSNINTMATSTKEVNLPTETPETETAKQNVETEAEKNSASSSISDLLYRKYQIGTNMSEGKIICPKETITNSSENPQAIVIFHNDSVAEIIPYEGKDIEYEIQKAGNYAFFILEEDKSLIDISAKTTSFSEVNESLLLPLN